MYSLISLLRGLTSLPSHGDSRAFLSFLFIARFPRCTTHPQSNREPKRTLHSGSTCSILPVAHTKEPTSYAKEIYRHEASKSSRNSPILRSLDSLLQPLFNTLCRSRMVRCTYSYYHGASRTIPQRYSGVGPNGYTNTIALHTRYKSNAKRSKMRLINLIYY